MLGLSIPEVAGRARVQRDAATLALTARMTVAPSEARVALIDGLVRALKDAGVWAKLDLLYLLAAHDAQAARLNWVSSGFALSAVGAPVFTTDRGYAGDGAAAYLDTGWSPRTQALAYALNSGSMGCWLNGGTDSADNAAVAMGVSMTPGAIVVPRGSAGQMRGRLNASATVSATGGLGTTRLGFTALSRTDGATTGFYRDGALDSVIASTATLLPANSVFLGGADASGVLGTPVDNRFAAAFAGAGLSAGEMATLFAALSAYLAGVGAI